MFHPEFLKSKPTDQRSWIDPADQLRSVLLAQVAQLDEDERSVVRRC